MFATKFRALSQNILSIACLVLKLLQNIAQGGGTTPRPQAAQSVNC